MKSKALLKHLPPSARPSSLNWIPADLPRISLADLITPSPALLFLCGVNGSGKTTAIAKLIKSLITHQGLQTADIGVIGTDTFRSAAMAQLQKRLAHFQCDLWIPPTGLSNPKASTVLFQGLEQFLPHKRVIVIDTSGRLHTDKNLMIELRTLTQKGIDWAKEKKTQAQGSVILVCDATHGHTLSAQLDHFAHDLPLRGVIYTKVDCLSEPAAFVTHLHKHPLAVLGLGTGEKDEDFWF